ncbi:hypothetical protein [Agrobacterium vitis]|uniref:hypothetical protein n=1 Tax=Agrobacterium vitis TaxID=373 RepID=UPI003D2B3776
MSFSPINPGPVDWSGENPGIYLKESDDGPWTGLMCFYRVVCSPFGMGNGIVVLDEPNTEAGAPDVANVCINDNELLARYLTENFFSKFAAFSVSPGVKAMSFLPMTGLRREGDTRTSYSEIVQAEGWDVIATWKGLGVPYAVDMPPELGPTKKHQMYSVFVDADDANVTINGRPLKGNVVKRNFPGEKKSSAFLAFSESWMRIAE